MKNENEINELGPLLNTQNLSRHEHTDQHTVRTFYTGRMCGRMFGPVGDSPLG